MADIRNDPSFDYHSASMNANKRERQKRSPPKQRPSGNPVSVHKLNVNGVSTPPDTTKKVFEPDKCCPLHNTKHALNECKGFRGKTIEEREMFLKEKGICF